MKKQLLFIHGGSSFSEYSDYLNTLKVGKFDPLAESPKRWAKTLAENLGVEYEVFATTFPNKYNAKYEEWSIWFERHFEHLRDGVILVGWSQGSLFLQKYLSQNTVPVQVKKLVLLASPHDYFKNEHTGEDGGDFNLSDDDNVASIAQKVNEVILVHSTDDFVVPYAHTQHLAAKIPEAQLITYEDKNHFLQEEFPELINMIKS